MSEPILFKPEMNGHGAGVGATVPLPLGGTGTGTKLRRLDIAKLANTEPPPIPWLIEDLAAKGELTMLFGVGGVAKSLALMALANGVLRGEDVAGFKCLPGRVVYFDAENGEREIHRRVKGLGLSAEIVVYEVAELNLLDEADLHAVEKAILDARAELVVFDSLRTLLPGVEENDSGHMSLALTSLRGLAQRHDFAGVVIHHADKLGKTFRGSSAIRDQVSLSFKLGRKPNDPDRHRRFIETDKFRIGPEPETRWFRLVIEPPQVYLEPAEAPEPGSDQPPEDDQLTTAIKTTVADSKTAMALKDIAKAVDRDPKDGSVRRRLSALVDSGQLTKTGTTYRAVPVPVPPIGAGTVALGTKPDRPNPFLRPHA